MTFHGKLRATLVQTFGTPLLGERLSADSERADRATRVGGDIPDDALPVEGDVLGGHYRLVRRLGEGMFGRVYLAERTDVPEHRVALKVVKREVYGGRDVERELVMLAAITHPNIVQLKDHGMTADCVWLTMPLYEGETLAERLERGPLTLREGYDVFVPIARGVHALHRRGLRHQDIKPENIFLAEIGGQVHPVLLDLGVAVEAGSPFVAGTALYGAPEQIIALGGLEGDAELSEKMDTYCLAATLLRSLVGADAFPGEHATSPFDIAKALEVRERRPIADDVLEGLTGAPRVKLQQAFRRWLTREPDDRPHAGRMADELDALLEQEREAAAVIEAEIAAQKVSIRRFRVLLGAAALVGAGVLSWGVSHRETLRLVRELDQARAAGADSFDKLDTCAAAHALARREVASCGQARRDDAAAHRLALSAANTAHHEAAKQLEGQLNREKRRVRSCADEKHQAAQTCTTEQEALATSIAERDKGIATLKASLTKTSSDLQTAKAERKQWKAKFDERSAEHEQCNAALASCVVERDAKPVCAPPPAKPGTTSDKPAAPAESPQPAVSSEPAKASAAAPAKSAPEKPTAATSVPEQRLAAE